MIHITKTGAFGKTAELIGRLSSLNDDLIALQCESNNSPPAGQLEQYLGAKRLTREMLTVLVNEIRVWRDNRIEIVWNFMDWFSR